MSGVNISVFSSLEAYKIGKPTLRLDDVDNLMESKVGGWNIYLKGGRRTLSLPKDVILLLEDAE